MIAKQCVNLVLSPVYITYTQVIKLFIMACGDNEYILLCLLFCGNRGVALFYLIYIIEYM